MKLFIVLFIGIAHRISCNPAYGGGGGYKAPMKPMKSSAQLGLTVGIEKEEVFLKKDPGQLVVQLGDNGGPHGMPHMGGGYGGSGGGDHGYGGGMSGGHGGGGSYEGEYGGGGGDGKVTTTEYSGGYGDRAYGGGDAGYDVVGGGDDGGYGGGGSGGYDDGCGSCGYGGGGGDGYSGMGGKGGAYYQLGEAAQKMHGGGMHYQPPPKPGKAPMQSYGTVQSYVVQGGYRTANDYAKSAPNGYRERPKSSGKHYKAGTGSGNLEYIKLGNGDAYEDTGMVVSSGKYVAPAYDHHRLGVGRPPTAEARGHVAVAEHLPAETRRLEDLDFASDEFHNQFFDEMLANQGMVFGDEFSL